MVKDFKIIFVHGYTASSKENWYPNISKKLTELGIDFVVPDLPGGEYPYADEWLDVIRKEVVKTNKPLVFVGHSLGTRAILLYLEKYMPKVEAVFLIATFANRLENATKYKDEYYPDFFTNKVDIQKVKMLSKKWVIVHSKDDDLEYEQAVEISEELNAKLISPDGRGHMSEPENAPYILEVLRKELDF